MTQTAADWDKVMLAAVEYQSDPDVSTTFSPNCRQPPKVNLTPQDPTPYTFSPNCRQPPKVNLKNLQDRIPENLFFCPPARRQPPDVIGLPRNTH